MKPFHERVKDLSKKMLDSVDYENTDPGVIQAALIVFAASNIQNISNIFGVPTNQLLQNTIDDLTAMLEMRKKT